MSRCPTSDEVDAALEHVADASCDCAVRAHVGQCDACLARFGAGFELELWGGAIPDAISASAPQAPPRLVPVRQRPSLVPLAAAAIGLLLTGAAAWFHERAALAPVAARPAQPFLRTLELVTRIGTRGPDGAVDRTTTFRASDPLVLQIHERRRNRDGLVETHETVLPLADARLQ